MIPLFPENLFNKVFPAVLDQRVGVSLILLSL